MESRSIKVILFTFYVFSCVSCNNHTAEEALPAGIETGLFESGDIICRLGNGMFSNLFRMHSEEKCYSHVGVVYITGDSAYVVHAEANELTGIGFVKKEPLGIFLANSREWGLYRMKKDKEVRDNISACALRYADNKTPFDMNFNLNDDNKVYCTQLAAIAINKAAGETIIAPGYTFNGRLFYTVDDIYLHPEFACIFKSKNP